MCCLYRRTRRLAHCFVPRGRTRVGKAIIFKLYFTAIGVGTLIINIASERWEPLLSSALSQGASRLARDSRVIDEQGLLREAIAVFRKGT